DGRVTRPRREAPPPPRQETDSIRHRGACGCRSRGRTWMGYVPRPRRSGPVPDGPAGAVTASRGRPPVAETCTHLSTVADGLVPSSAGCEDGLRTGDRWVHLRMCMTCGHVGCCDSSPNRHASAHWRAHPDHPLVRSYEPGEDWWW